jgi:hypothetical protein
VRVASGPDPPGSSRCVFERRRTSASRVCLSATLATPASSGSADTSWLCRAACHPSRHLPEQADPSFTAPLRRDGGEGLSPPLNQQAPHGAPAARLTLRSSPTPVTRAAFTWPRQMPRLPQEVAFVDPTDGRDNSQGRCAGGGAGVPTRAQQSNTDQQMSFRTLWSSITSSRIASGSWSRCHWHSSRPAASLSPSGAAARAALIA